MFESEGKLSARIVALSEPKTAEGKEKTDIYNPDPKKRNHPIIGLVFISGFTKKSDTRRENGDGLRPEERQNLFLLSGTAGIRQNQGPRVYWYCVDGPKLHLDQSEPRSATAFPTHFPVSRHTQKQR